MAWTSMHFAVGMGCGAAIAGVGCLIARRGYRFMPVAATFGGIWAFVPDMPRLFREDFPSLPFAATLGDQGFETWLHSIGNVFFFHRSLDAQPREFALHGLFLTIVMYNLIIAGLWWHNRRLKRRATGGNARAAARSGEHAGGGDGDPNSPVIGRIRSSHLHRTG